MERLNLRQLEIFSAVVDAGSFTAAAEKLYLAQSTVSDNVRALEELLHLKLFHRESKRRLTLTLEGKRVYRYAQDILGRCSALLLDVAVDSALELTLGASTVPAQSLLPGYMARFARENPACRCTLLCGDSAAVQQMLLNGDIHLGFVGSADDRQDLIYEPIAEDRLVLITPNTPRFAALKTQGVLGRELVPRAGSSSASAGAARRRSSTTISARSALTRRSSTPWPTSPTPPCCSGWSRRARAYPSSPHSRCRRPSRRDSSYNSSWTKRPCGAASTWPDAGKAP